MLWPNIGIVSEILLDSWTCKGKCLEDQAYIKSILANQQKKNVVEVNEV